MRHICSLSIESWKNLQTRTVGVKQINARSAAPDVKKMDKIKLKLNSIQIKTLQMWNYHHRYTYNKTISLLNEGTERPLYKDVKPENSNTYYSKLELRNLIVPESCCSRIKWILETPKAIRESAVFESYKNLQSAISNLKNGHIRYFNLRYKSKKLLKWTIGVPKESIKDWYSLLPSLTTCIFKSGNVAFFLILNSITYKYSLRFFS